MIQARETGIIERGENSKSNNSIARNIPAMGLPKIADIPAVAPAASNILRSLLEIFIICPMVEPNAPPDTIIGPSAPKGSN